MVKCEFYTLIYSVGLNLLYLTVVLITEFQFLYENIFLIKTVTFKLWQGSKVGSALGTKFILCSV